MTLQHKVGQRYGKVTITKVGSSHYFCQCDCGAPEIRKNNGSMVPEFCMDCRKDKQKKVNYDANNAIMVKEIKPAERAMIDAFIAKKPKRKVNGTTPTSVAKVFRHWLDGGDLYIKTSHRKGYQLFTGDEIVIHIALGISYSNEA